MITKWYLLIFEIVNTLHLNANNLNFVKRKRNSFDAVHSKSLKMGKGSSIKLRVCYLQWKSKLKT